MSNARGFWATIASFVAVLSLGAALGWFAHAFGYEPRMHSAESKLSACTDALSFELTRVQAWRLIVRRSFQQLEWECGIARNPPPVEQNLYRPLQVIQ
jgi:hypothetical protein